jgi:predicted GH43/DUF377 family glycosyl hydrolase
VLDGPLKVIYRYDKPLVFPEYDYESHGVEDPRITKIDDHYYLSYTAYNGMNALGALAVSTDLRNFEKKGIIVPQVTYEEFRHLAEGREHLNEKYFHIHEFIPVIQMEGKILLWDKNVVFFPRRINGKLYFFHRIKPGIQIVCVNDLRELTKKFWEDYLRHLDEHIVLDPKFPHEMSHIGAGAVPIETEKGWILIYHGVRDTRRGYVYSACAALLKLDDPSQVIARLPHTLFSPGEEWEKVGYVNNVVFPTGTALFDDTLYIYYGAADEQIACASLSISELLKELLDNPTDNEK